MHDSLVSSFFLFQSLPLTVQSFSSLKSQQADAQYIHEQNHSQLAS